MNKKHTFKVRDRVKSVGYVNSRALGDEYGKVVKVMPSFVGVTFDNKNANRCDGRWSLLYDEVQHDTDFQVGDWVRYEAVDPHGNAVFSSRNGNTGKIVKMERDLLWAPPGLPNGHFISNCVKIQPPQEEQMDTVNIQHNLYGIVEGVREVVLRSSNGSVSFTTWIKEGQRYLLVDGWAPVKEKEWITIQVEKDGWEEVDHSEGTICPLDTHGGPVLVAWRYPLEEEK